MAGRSRFVAKRNAVGTIIDVAKPQAHKVAEAIAARLPSNVPVHHGVAVRTYRPVVRDTADGAQVFPGSPLWHLLEYGTAYSPPYRPVETTVRQLRVRFEAH